MATYATAQDALTALDRWMNDPANTITVDSFDQELQGILRGISVEQHSGDIDGRVYFAYSGNLYDEASGKPYADVPYDSALLAARSNLQAYGIIDNTSSVRASWFIGADKDASVGGWRR